MNEWFCFIRELHFKFMMTDARKKIFVTDKMPVMLWKIPVSYIVSYLKGQSHEKVGEMRVQGDSPGPN
jgi:hypothetical protein